MHVRLASFFSSSDPEYIGGTHSSYYGVLLVSWNAIAMKATMHEKAKLEQGMNYVSMHEWQTTFYPSCNVMREVKSQNLPGPQKLVILNFTIVEAQNALPSKEQKRSQQYCNLVLRRKKRVVLVLIMSLLRNNRIKFKECFETILSLGVNISNASLT